MNNYKFGNMICSMRESFNLTQKELAKLLDVSDKAVSKWENGQAIPRMETLEKIAEIFKTTVQDILASCNDNVKRILVFNDFGAVLHFQINEKFFSLNIAEEKWIELDSNIDEYKVRVYGDFRLEEFIETDEELKTFKEKIVYNGVKRLSKWADKEIKRQIIFTKCSYTLSGIQDGQKITVVNEMFSAGDKMWIYKDMIFSYPKLVCDCQKLLTNAECINKSDALIDFKKRALTSELGISIPLMLIAYPFRKMYFKSIIKPNGLMKFISNADYYVEKNTKEESKRKKHPVLKGIGILILCVLLWIFADVGIGVLSVDTQKPVLVSSDYSTIEYYRDEYVRIDDLPKDAVLNKKLGIEIWTDARIDGYSKIDQYFDEHKVTEFIDRDGNIYLWLVPDYIDTITDENGDYKEYDDFTEHYVYAQKK